MESPVFLTEDQILDQIEHSLRNYALRDIKVISSGNTVIACFMLCSCFIDQMSGFRYNRSGVKSRFIEFVSTYLKKYDPEKLHSDLRNKLVHNYSLGNSYSLTKEYHYFHLNQSKEDSQRRLLNLDRFIEDLEEAFNLYMSQLRRDPECKNNALRWFETHNIIGAGKMNIQKKD